MDMTYLQLEQEYTDILDNFWQIYMPIYEDRGSSGIHAALENYFVTSRDTALSPLDKSELISALSQMMTRSSDIQWIALYEAERPVNYILFNTGPVCRKCRRTSHIWKSWPPPPPAWRYMGWSPSPTPAARYTPMPSAAASRSIWVREKV